MRVLIVEDVEARIDILLSRASPNDVLTVCMSGRQGVDFVRDCKYKFDLVFLDHDLGDDITGLHVARELASLSEDLKPGMVVIHSWNPAGVDDIASVLVKANIPFAKERFTVGPHVRWDTWELCLGHSRCLPGQS